MNDPTLGQLGERAIVDRLRNLIPRGDDVATGIGDDAAVVQWNDRHDLVLTSDAIIEGVHFEDSAAPRQVGHKATSTVAPRSRRRFTPWLQFSGSNDVVLGHPTGVLLFWGLMLEPGACHSERIKNFSFHVGAEIFSGDLFDHVA